MGPSPCPPALGVPGGLVVAPGRHPALCSVALGTVCPGHATGPLLDPAIPGSYTLLVCGWRLHLYRSSGQPLSSVPVTCSGVLCVPSLTRKSNVTGMALCISLTHNAISTHLIPCSASSPDTGRASCSLQTVTGLNQPFPPSPNHLPIFPFPFTVLPQKKTKPALAFSSRAARPL